MKLLKKHYKYIVDIVLAAALVFLFAVNALWVLENRAQDALYQRLGLLYPNVYVIGIDEKAMERFGPVREWNRQIMADAIDILNSGGEYDKPAVIALDVLYTGGSAYPEADRNLAAAAERGGNVVVGSLAEVGQDMSLSNVVQNHVLPYAALERHTAHGLVNGIMDGDSVIRNALLKTQFGGETLYSFPYEIYRQYTWDELDFARDNNQVHIAYSGMPGDYYAMSFADIFEDDFDPLFFADAVVMIGAYAAGLMDSYNTPVSGDVQMHGVEIHANALVMMLREDFKVEIPFWLNLTIMTVLTLAALVLADRLDIRLVFGIFAAFSVGYIFLAWFLYERGHISFLIYPVLSVMTVYVYKLVYRYILGALEKQRIKGAFKKYVDPKLVDKLMESGEAHSDEVGVKKNIAVLFVDVRGFTPMTEALQDSPEVIVEILNEYLELTTTAVFNNGGSVDKFIGDATMALFNGFVPLDDYVYKAVKAAVEIVQGAAGVNSSIKEKYGVDVGFGVGVNFGDAIVGNLGPSFRKDYTAIGDAVNTAARLESSAARSQVLISKAVYDEVKERIIAESVGEISLKGKSERFEVFAVTGVL